MVALSRYWREWIAADGGSGTVPARHNSVQHREEAISVRRWNASSPHRPSPIPPPDLEIVLPGSDRPLPSLPRVVTRGGKCVSRPDETVGRQRFPVHWPDHGCCLAARRAKNGVRGTAISTAPDQRRPQDGVRAVKYRAMQWAHRSLTARRRVGTVRFQITMGIGASPGNATSPKPWPQSGGEGNRATLLFNGGFPVAPTS